MDELIELQKCINTEHFIEMINDCIETLENLKESLLKEIYYDE